MKLSYRQIEPFVNNPDPDVRVILIYGPDYGLMKERAAKIGKSVVEDLNDPFNVISLSTEQLNDDPAKLSDEANAMSMMGGKRLIRIDNASDKITMLLDDYLENPNDDALILALAGELTPRSSLRKFCEKHAKAAAVPCYIEDERNLAGFIRSFMQENGYQIEHDAVLWLSVNIGGDRQKTRSELEKIILYKGDERAPITNADVMAICGAAGAQTLDNLVYAVAGRDTNTAMRSFQTLLGEGVALIAILRALQNHFRRLHLTKSMMDEGAPLEKAMKSLSPPIFFKQENAFKNQVGRYSHKALSHICARLSELEAQTKQSNTPNETICAQAILSLSKAR